MDSFKIGDKVIYPNQGIGIIEDIKEANLFGETFRIYHVRILANNSLVLVPVTNTGEVGLRRPISSEVVEDIFEFIRSSPIDIHRDWKERYKENQNLMKSGKIFDVILVLKGLYYLNLQRSLSFREKAMMEKAKELIISELAEATSLSALEIEKKLEECLAQCFLPFKSEPQI
ncbi:MAG: hypothetical protein N3B16_00770 [Candidatus Aminicenantes bacterium]|nr:hypothetical protein [Candidatus Aminicenantes bacterium]